MKAYKTTKGIIIHSDDNFYLFETDWDEFINQNNLIDSIRKQCLNMTPLTSATAFIEQHLLPPLGSQEIWASGVTYYKSREARMEESKDAGGGDFYDRVYSADRPELFFKSAAFRAVGHMQNVRIRKDSKWNVPEPELTLLINSSAEIIGYTIGNDMSSRDIEGENPLYLPQAKSYDGAAAIGPCVYLTEEALSPDTSIAIQIVRNGNEVFSGTTLISQIKRTLSELVEYLFRETSFPQGCFLMTGTGIVPPDTFTLDHGDLINISIQGIGTLTNTVE